VNGFEVDTDAMRQHAARVYELTEQAGRAVSASRDVAFPPEMYGRIGSALVAPFMLPLASAGVLATEAMSSALEETAAGIKAAAGTYELVDDAVRDLMRKLGELR
jgi:uncharacterized protein YukE